MKMSEAGTNNSMKHKWMKRLDVNEEKLLVAKAFAVVCGLRLKEDSSDITKMPNLTTIVEKAMKGLNTEEIVKNNGTLTTYKITGKKKNKNTVIKTEKKELSPLEVTKIPAFQTVYDKLVADKFDGLLFYKPYSKNPTTGEVNNGEVLPAKFVSTGEISVDDVNAIINKLNKIPFGEISKTPIKNKGPKTITLDQATIDAINKKEPSVEEQIKNTVMKIAKNKELMNLSKEQLRDYLRDAYEITDEDALNNMMNAVVAKRAELLANKQLKHEELTEIDISKLQEQSQRDFEKKLQDQNLRYILPAQIEKRERLVQNHLNPELLKGGY